jgi:hypothetical protein
MSRLLAAEAWWRTEMRVLRTHWVRSGWAMLDVDADVPQ